MVDHGASALRNSCCNMQEVRASLLGGAEGSERCDIISIPRIEKTNKNDPFFEAEQNPNLLSGFGERAEPQNPAHSRNEIQNRESRHQKYETLYLVPPPMYNSFLDVPIAGSYSGSFRLIQFRSLSNIIILISHVSHSSNRSRYFPAWNGEETAPAKFATWKKTRLLERRLSCVLQRMLTTWLDFGNTSIIDSTTELLALSQLHSLDNKH